MGQRITVPDMLNAYGDWPAILPRRVPAPQHEGMTGMWRRSSLLLFAMLLIAPVHAQAPPTGDSDILQFLEKVTKAYNAGDAKALAALWSQEGELIDEDEGTRLIGRADIEAAYAKSFDKDNLLRLEIDVDKIRRITPDVVLVEAKTTVIKKTGSPDRSYFNAVLVRKGGEWLLDQTREKDIVSDPTAADNLAELDWMNGSWKYVNGTTEITIDVHDISNGNFRLHKFKVTEKGEITHEGTQVIGWDASRKQIRSWTFSSDGSFGEGLWESKTNRWTCRMTGVLASGQKTASIRLLAIKDKDHFTFHSVDRTVDGRSLPDQDEVTMTRVPVVAAAPPSTKEK
jgi:uncharacterized protein (TIGR02246 family)